MKISIDAMRGEYGPSSTIPATINILREHPAISLIQVYGDKNQIEDTLNLLFISVPQEIWLVAFKFIIPINLSLRLRGPQMLSKKESQLLC